MNQEERHDMTDEEKNQMLQFMQPTSKFSLMSEIFIRKNFPEVFD